MAKRANKNDESDFQETPYNPVPFLTANLDTTEIGGFHPADQLQKLVDHTNSVIEEQAAVPDDTYLGPDADVEEEDEVGVDHYDEKDSGGVVEVADDEETEAVKKQQDENLKNAEADVNEAADALAEAVERESKNNPEPKNSSEDTKKK